MKRLSVTPEEFMVRVAKEVGIERLEKRIIGGNTHYVAENFFADENELKVRKAYFNDFGKVKTLMKIFGFYVIDQLGLDKLEEELKLKAENGYKYSVRAGTIFAEFSTSICDSDDCKEASPFKISFVTGGNLNIRFEPMKIENARKLLSMLGILDKMEDFLYPWLDKVGIKVTVGQFIDDPVGSIILVKGNAQFTDEIEMFESHYTEEDLKDILECMSELNLSVVNFYEPILDIVQHHNSYRVPLEVVLPKVLPNVDEFDDSFELIVRSKNIEVSYHYYDYLRLTINGLFTPIEFKTVTDVMKAMAQHFFNKTPSLPCQNVVSRAYTTAYSMLGNVTLEINGGVDRETTLFVTNYEKLVHYSKDYSLKQLLMAIPKIASIVEESKVSTVLIKEDSDDVLVTIEDAYFDEIFSYYFGFRNHIPIFETIKVAGDEVLHYLSRDYAKSLTGKVFIIGDGVELRSVRNFGDYKVVTLPSNNHVSPDDDIQYYTVIADYNMPDIDTIVILFYDKELTKKLKPVAEFDIEVLNDV